ncbi:hypothetical protein TetV_632 [Tetraselmis virus 1]|uniref:Uncharacterized protein n=1 Tax=Tetraselmis virus 1 TaxID=2060617 RepID=A0A2P0VP81_9VIRU|nr:hypothetical protein QJ968_gp422 [Tetraselmis virus 1]AUF82714.1 hypothetical protein TetV_632 [Tetraselmis virus 1]
MLNYSHPMHVISAILVTAMYMLSGLEKFTKVPKVAAGLQKRTVPSLPLMFYQVVVMISSSMLVLTSGVIMFAAGFKHSKPELRKWGKYACYYLIAFTGLATLIYHFPPVGSTYYPFISNLTAIGGLLALSAVL